MVTDPTIRNEKPIRTPEPVPGQVFFRHLTIASGLLAVGVSLAGVLAARAGIAIIGGAVPGNRTIALSAALIWIILGTILAQRAAKPFGRMGGLAVQAILVLIAVFGAGEFLVSISGSRFFIETFFVNAGVTVIGPSSAPISPIAAGLAVPAALALALLIQADKIPRRRSGLKNITSLLGLVVSFVSITFVMSYAYGNPLLYGTQLIPIAFMSALAAFFTAVSLVAAAGPGAVPVRYLIGTSTRARLLRVFVPLVAVIILAENFIFVLLSAWFSVRDAVLLSSILIVFLFATGLIVVRVSGGLGTALDEAEQELVRKNEDLGAANEELTATQEELRQTNDELVAHERHLTRNNEELNALNEELTATQEELHQTIDNLTVTEGTLRASETRLRRFYDSGLLGVFYWNMDGVITDANDRFLETTGYSRADLTSGRIDWINMTPPEFRHLDEISVQELGDTGANAHPFEKEYIRKDGTRVPVMIAGAMLDDTRFDGVAFVLDITERKKAEQALAETEKEKNLLAEFLNRSEQPFGIGYPDGRLGITNGAFERLTGYTAGEFRKVDWGTVLTPPEWRETERKKLEELNRTGVPVRYEKEYLRKDGSRVPVELLVHIVKDNEGNPLNYYSFITNITERRRAEEDLKNTLDRFYLILSGMRHAVLLVAADNRAEFANQAFCDFFGLCKDPAELSGKTAGDILELIRPAYADPAVSLARIGEIARNGEPVLGEDVPMSNGRSFLRDFMPVRVGGRLYGRLWVHVDITARKKAEEALRESEEKYRNLFANMTEEVHFWKLVRDGAGQIVTWRLVDANPPSLKTWGKTREEVVGKTTDEIFGPGATAHFMPIVRKIMEEDVPYAYEDFFPNLDRYFRFTSVPLGEYFITTGSDITVLKKAENDLRRKNEDLNALNEEITATQEELHQNLEELALREVSLSTALAEKEVLLSEIHHRVKNNLTAFISLLSLEGSIEETPAGKQLKQDLQNRARSMALVHETLYRTHLYNDVDMEIYLTTLLDQIATSFGTSQSVRTVVDVHGVMLDIPRATPAGLIINELVTNSFKYAFPESFDAATVRGAPPTIGITLTKTGTMYQLIVRDNGIGLPPEVDLAKTQSLGLKLVSFLAKHQLRAKIEVKDTNGTEFMFRFKE